MLTAARQAAADARRAEVLARIAASALDAHIRYRTFQRRAVGTLPR